MKCELAPAQGCLLTSKDSLNGLLKALLLNKGTQVAGGDKGCFVANKTRIST